MKKIISLFICLSFTSLVSATNFKPQNCKLIQDVQINHKPSITDDLISFSSDDIQISLSENSYAVNQQTISLEDYPTYFHLVESFFHNANQFSSYLGQSFENKQNFQSMTEQDWMDAFSKTDSNEFYEKALSMCQVILELYEANQNASKQDQGFVPGILISLKQS